MGTIINSIPFIVSRCLRPPASVKTNEFRKKVTISLKSYSATIFLFVGSIILPLVKKVFFLSTGADYWYHGDAPTCGIIDSITPHPEQEESFAGWFASPMIREGIFFEVRQPHAAHL
jgi:hypothetical protein